jgi:CysZ protein
MVEFIKGFLSFFRAFGFIFKHRLAKWYLAPMLLWLLLVLGSTISLATWLYPVISEWLNAFFDVQVVPRSEGFWKSLWTWMQHGLTLATAWILHLLLLYFLGRMMKYVILIITSPLLAWISERTEEILTGASYPFQLLQLMKDALRGIAITLRNLLIELTLIGLGFFLSIFFPAAGLFITIFLFLVSSYFMGFSMFDYYTERQKMSIGRSVKFMRQQRPRVLGLGLAFNLVGLIPFADWVIAPVNGAVGAVLSMDSELLNKAGSGTRTADPDFANS